jgi:hypothetical protein
MISVHFDASPVVDFKSAAKDNDTFKVSWHVASGYIRSISI